MKKFLKLIIALVVIAGLAVGAYFIFSSRDNSKAVYNNMYELSYNVKIDNKNVITSVDDAVLNMLNIIETNLLDIQDTQKSLELFLILKNNYSVIGNEILTNGAFTTKNEKVNSYLSNANKAYGKVKDVYKKAYNYLKTTYYKIVDTNYNIATMQTYIVNFEIIFRNILSDYNSFYYNSSVAYSHILNNMMVKNNAYKLQVEYFANLINNYYNAEEALKAPYLTLIQSTKTYLQGDFVGVYFENKTIYDKLINNSLDLNITVICDKIAQVNINEYINSLQDENQKTLNKNYVSKVARG